MNCEGICNLTCLWLSCTKWLFDHSFDLLYLVEVQLETIMLNAMTTNENKYHDLQPRSQRKGGNITKTFAFVFHHSIQPYSRWAFCRLLMDREAKRPPPWNLDSYTLPKEDPENIWITWHTPRSLLTSVFFTGNKQILQYQKIQM